MGEPNNNNHYNVLVKRYQKTNVDHPSEFTNRSKLYLIR